MLAWLVTIAVALTVIGVGLIVIGVRGRRVDKHPICAACGFDLVGRFPWSAPTMPACPDCGTPLLGPGSVRPGARRKRSAIFVAGMMLVFPSVLVLALTEADRLGLVNATKITPTPQLLVQAGGSPSMPGAGDARSIDRLLIRWRDGALDGAETASLVKLALAAQGDRNNALKEQWMAVLRRCALAPGALNNTQKTTLLQNGFALRARPRAVVEAGRPVPLELSGVFDRLPWPGGSNRKLSLTLRDVFVDNQPSAMRHGKAQAQTIELGANPGEAFRQMLWVDAPVNEGEHLITMVWECRIKDGNQEVAWWSIDSVVTVTGRTGQAVAVENAGGMRDKLEKALRPAELLAWTDESGKAHLRWASKPRPLPCDFYGTIGILPGTGMGAAPIGAFEVIQTDPDRGVRWEQDWTIPADLVKQTVTLVLEPRAADAVKDTLSLSVWGGGNLLLIDVPVRWITRAEAEATGGDKADKP